MAATETLGIPLGYEAPDFYLPDTVSGEMFSLQEIKGKEATVVVFICNHCPYVLHVIDTVVAMANEYLEHGVHFIAISSNDVEAYPQDAPEKMKEFAAAHAFPFLYLYDESQDVAKAYHAACTPDFSIFDKDLKCVYRGQLDDSRPGSQQPPTGKDIRSALDALLKSAPVSTVQKPSIGCGIKWKAEKE